MTFSGLQLVTMSHIPVTVVFPFCLLSRRHLAQPKVNNVHVVSVNCFKFDTIQKLCPSTINWQQQQQQ